MPLGDKALSTAKDSMLTDCSSCGATFRVTPEQLGAFGGRVRCGECGDVFDAFAKLRAEPRAEPEPEIAKAPEPAVAPEGAGGEAVTEESDARSERTAPAGLPVDDSAALDDSLVDVVIPAELLDLAFSAEDEPARSVFPEPEAADFDAMSETLVNADIPTHPAPGDSEDPSVSPAFEAPAEPFDPAATLVEPAPAPAPAPAPTATVQSVPPSEAPAPAVPPRLEEAVFAYPETQSGGPPSSSGAIEGFEALDEPAPDELKQESPPAATRKPRGRGALLAFAVVILTLLLPVQGILFFRDQIADRVPGMHAPLDAMCRSLGCRVALPRWTDKLEIETSDLQALDPSRPNRVVLIASVRNLAPVTQAFPWLELTLTDPEERALVKQVFEPAQYLPETVRPEQGFGAQSDVPIRLQLDTGSVVASGYRLFLYHP